MSEYVDEVKFEQAFSQKTYIFSGLLALKIIGLTPPEVETKKIIQKKKSNFRSHVPMRKLESQGPSIPPQKLRQTLLRCF